MSHPNGAVAIPRSASWQNQNGGFPSQAASYPAKGADMRGSHTSQQYKQGEGYPTATQGEAYWHYENNLQQQGYQFGDKRLSQPQAYSSGAESHMPNHHSYSQVVRTGTPQQGTKHRGGMTGPVPVPVQHSQEYGGAQDKREGAGRVGDTTPRQRKPSYRVNQQAIVDEEDTVKSKNGITAGGGDNSGDRTSQSSQTPIAIPQEHPQDMLASPPTHSSPIVHRRPKINTEELAIPITETQVFGRATLEPLTETETRQTVGDDESYHGDIKGKDAIKILRGSGKSPCYLTRWSEVQQCYILTVYQKERPRARDVEKHFKIEVDPRYKIEGKEKEFDDIQQLLEFYEEPNWIYPTLQKIGQKYTKKDYIEDSKCTIL